MEGNVRRSLIALGLSNFFGNVEYTVIMPSIFHYLKSKGEHHYWFLGLTLASFNIVQMMSGFLISMIINKRPMREGILICILFGIIGNTIYGFAENGWMILAGRALCGVSGNIGIIQNTYIGKVVEEKKRSPIFSILGSVSGFGILTGPALNLGLSQIDFTIKGFNINPNNVPGFFLIVCQLVLSLIVIFLFNEPNASEFYRSQIRQETNQHQKNQQTNSIRKLFSASLIALYAAGFLSVFNETTLETIITPIGKQYFHWNSLENSFFFASITVVFLIMFLIIHILSSRLGWSDRKLILMGHLFQGIGFFIFLGINISDKITGDTIVLWKFILPCTFIVIGLPFGWVSIGSLISKQVSDSLQSSVSAVNNFVLSLACILGPLWSGFSLGIDLLVLVSLVILLWICSSSLMAWNWSKLIPINQETKDLNGKLNNVSVDSMSVDSVSSIPISISQPNEKTALISINT